MRDYVGTRAKVLTEMTSREHQYIEKNESIIPTQYEIYLFHWEPSSTSD